MLVDQVIPIQDSALHSLFDSVIERQNGVKEFASQAEQGFFDNDFIKPEKPVVFLGKLVGWVQPDSKVKKCATKTAFIAQSSALSNLEFLTWSKSLPQELQEKLNDLLSKAKNSVVDLNTFFEYESSALMLVLEYLLGQGGQK